MSQKHLSFGMLDFFGFVFFQWAIINREAYSVLLSSLSVVKTSFMWLQEMKRIHNFCNLSVDLLLTYSVRQQKLNLFTPELPKQFSCLSPINLILKTCWLCFIFLPTNMMLLSDRKSKCSYSRQNIEQQGKIEPEKKITLE